MLTRDNAVLVVVDVQGNLAHAMHEQQPLFANLEKLIKGTQVLGVPLLLTEQNPARLGPTLPQLAELLPQVQPISKLSFSCWGDPGFVAALTALNRRQVLLAGIEAHVCVYQTATALVEQGYEVHVISDAVSSRTAPNKAIGLERMQEHGAHLSSTEMALFELMRIAEGATFKALLKIVK